MWQKRRNKIQIKENGRRGRVDPNWPRGTELGH